MEHKDAAGATQSGGRQYEEPVPAPAQAPVVQQFDGAGDQDSWDAPQQQESAQW